MAVLILCLLNFVIGYQLTLQCKISDKKFKRKGTAQLWLVEIYICVLFNDKNKKFFKIAMGMMRTVAVTSSAP